MKTTGLKTLSSIVIILTVSIGVYGIKNLNDIVIIQKTGHRKPPIVFNHKAHVEKYNTECIDCHHKGTYKKCNACHLKRDQKNIINIKGAFHQQCHDCHRKTRGPKACGRCHKTN